MFRRSSPQPYSFFLLILLAILSLPIAQAATFTVANLNDHDLGSLRQAIINANAAPGTDAIVFAPNVIGTILLSNGAIEITGNVTLTGPGANALAISGNHASNIFSIGSGATVSISGVTLKDGSGYCYDPFGGGAICNGGTLTLDKITLSGNSTKGAGGAILSEGSLTITNSTLSGNSSSGAYGGGAIYSQGTLTISNSAFTGNSAADSGGAIYQDSGTLTISNSTLSSNQANRDAGSGTGGGAIFLDYYSTLILANSVLTDNSSGTYGGGINGSSNSSPMTITNSTLSGNSASDDGGAIYSVGTLTLKNSTISGNSVVGNHGGGGIYTSYGNGTITNSTISGNSAGEGGGIYKYMSGSLTVINSTLSGNLATSEGGGIYNRGSSTFVLGNSLVIGNTAPDGASAYNYSGATFISQGHNLFGENGVAGLEGFLPNDSDQLLMGALSTAIGPLADNGGPTQTHLPVTGGQAIDAGDNALIPVGVIDDQRGYKPRIVGSAVDIGAVELGATPPNYPLTVNKTGGSGTIKSTPAGIDCGSTCTAEFLEETRVALTVTAAAGYSFTGWSGDCTGTTCTVTMDAAKNVTALFANLPTYTLTVTKPGTGTGTVTSDPSGINCGSTCAAPFTSGQRITLTAVPAAGSLFVKWSGCVVNPANPRQCTLTITANRTATAQFIKPPVLTVGKTGNGAGLITGPGITCGVDCSQTYPNTTTAVVLTATAYTGSVFVGWSGCTPLAANPRQCAVTMNQARTVLARFNTTAAGKNALTVYKANPGLGTVVSTPAGINCGPTCLGQAANFTAGSTILLTATPAIGSTFVGWSNCAPLAGNPRQCKVAMTAARIVTVRFNRPVLTVTKIGSGLVSSAPTGINCGPVCAAPFNFNTKVTLTAIPTPGFRFGSWRGCTPLANRQQCTVTMNQSKTATAVFE